MISAVFGKLELITQDERRAIHELSSEDGGFSTQYFDVFTCPDPLGKHAHAGKEETFTILSGEGRVLTCPVNMEGEAVGEVTETELAEGSVVHIPPMTAHTFYLNGAKMHCHSSAPFDDKDFIKTPWLV